VERFYARFSAEPAKYFIPTDLLHVTLGVVELKDEDEE